MARDVGVGAKKRLERVPRDRSTLCLGLLDFVIGQRHGVWHLYVELETRGATKVNPLTIVDAFTAHSIGAFGCRMLEEGQLASSARAFNDEDRAVRYPNTDGKLESDMGLRNHAVSLLDPNP